MVARIPRRAGAGRGSRGRSRPCRRAPAEAGCGGVHRAAAGDTDALSSTPIISGESPAWPGVRVKESTPRRGVDGGVGLGAPPAAGTTPRVVAGFSGNPTRGCRGGRRRRGRGRGRWSSPRKPAGERNGGIGCRSQAVLHPGPHPEGPASTRTGRTPATSGPYRSGTSRHGQPARVRCRTRRPGPAAGTSAAGPSRDRGRQQRLRAAPTGRRSGRGETAADIVDTRPPASSGDEFDTTCVTPGGLTSCPRHAQTTLSHFRNTA